ncbi:hypothetical protein CPLU01_12549 [Colletotrichum plurivorum]|uniref:Uncharacterized protein n=1 Tax=Colletotrichum plurivorum TaxID=2175906 RepID=A0A8H6N6F2_9PEZI|nr:hypothetical protein CPLU01_12549 [Colletotrichum plurivorum]
MGYEGYAEYSVPRQTRRLAVESKATNRRGPAHHKTEDEPIRPNNADWRLSQFRENASHSPEKVQRRGNCTTGDLLRSGLELSTRRLQRFRPEQEHRSERKFTSDSASHVDLITIQWETSPQRQKKEHRHGTLTAYTVAASWHRGKGDGRCQAGSGS